MNLQNAVNQYINKENRGEIEQRRNRIEYDMN